MGVRVAVIGNREPVTDKRPRHAEPQYLVSEGGRRVLRPFLEIGVGQRHRHTGLDERRRTLPLLGGNQIQRATLIVLAPAAPVRQLRHPLIDRVLRHGWARLRQRRDGDRAVDAVDAVNEEEGPADHHR